MFRCWLPAWALSIVLTGSLAGADLTGVDPNLVLAAGAFGVGGTRVNIRGTRLSSTDIVKIGKKDLLDQTFESVSLITGRVPDINPGFYAVELYSSRGVLLDSIDRAVEVTPPVTLTGVTPRTVFREGTTQVAVAGTNFRSVTTIRFGTHALVNPSVDRTGTVVTGIAPALAPTEPDGNYDVTAEDSRGRVRLAAGVTYTSAFRLDRVEPALVSTLGGTRVTFIGAGFQATATLKIGTKLLTNVQFVDGEHMTGDSPALAAGFHDAEISLSAVAGIVRVLPRAIEAAPPPQVRSITPSRIPTIGGTPVAITGANFRSATVFQLGDLQILNPVVAAGGGSVTGTAPAQSAGVKDVSAEDSRGKAILRGAVTYFVPEVPGPLVTETALAYGKARFEWENTYAYDQIQVLDEQERVIATLPGDATRYETASAGAEFVARKFRGVSRKFGPSVPSEGFAKIHQCEVPPPFIGLSQPGELEFTLFGGHAESGDPSCFDGSGPTGKKFDCPRNGFAHTQTVSSAIVQQGGAAAPTGGVGYVIQGSAALDIDPAIFQGVDRNKLTTGFTLPNEVDKLEIKVFLRKLGVAFGLELRGRLIHVYPDDGFADEFAFSDTIPKADKEWLNAVYYRSYVDGEGVRKQCLDGNGNPKTIPAGEYLLDIYAVGGNSKLPYYFVADDPLDTEILIMGSPCPPYPMVRVTDLTGFRTVPQVCCIWPEVVFYPGDMFPLTVHLHAQGLWLDTDNTPFRLQEDLSKCMAPGQCAGKIPPDAGVNNIPDFEYTWSIYELDEKPKTKINTGPTLYYYNLPDWGCYFVELKVRDKRCGLESTFSTQVAVFPEGALCEDSKLKPSTASLSQYKMKSAYLFTTPDPGNVFGVVGLKDADVAWRGEFNGKRPVQFNVLVVPCYCGSSNFASCPAPLLGPDYDPSAPVPNPDPTNDDIEFRLAIKTSAFTYTALPNPKIQVTDPCCAVSVGPKYLTVRIDDLGEIPYTPSLGQMQFRPVFFQARNRYYYDPLDGYKQKPANETHWKNIGSPLRLSNRPDVLKTSYWNGHFETGTASYHFLAKSAEDTSRKFNLGASNEMPIDMPDVDAGVPSYPSNDVNSGFTSRFMATGGEWFDEDATGNMTGSTMGNDLQGKPLQVGAKVKTLQGEGGGGSLVEFPYYEWCTKQEIFSLSIETSLFEAIIYSGTIGPVPVTIWASIGLGFDFLMEAYANVEVSPFAPLEGGNYLDLYFDLLTQIGIDIPCEIRADVLGGVASIGMWLRPEVIFTLIPYFHLIMGAQGENIDIDFCMSTEFTLYFGMEFCILFGALCFGTGDVALIGPLDIFPSRQAGCNRPGDCTGEGGGIPIEPAPPGGRGADWFSISFSEIAVAPVTIVSPDRKTVLDIWVEEDQGTILQMQLNGSSILASPVPGGYFLIDPAAAFVSNDAVLFAWTVPAYPVAALPPQSDPGYLAALNQSAARTEIQLASLVNVPNYGWRLFLLDTENVYLTDTSEAPAGEWRVDGKASVAGDLSSGEALLAWVRYEDDYMIQDGFTTVNVPCEVGENCGLCGGNPPRPCKFKRLQNIPNFRPQMEKTAIFVRRAGYRLEGQLAMAKSYTEHRSQPFKISPPGINIEPSISTSPSGNTSYCVWVHDPTHTDLIQANRGRQILYAVYTKNPADLDDPAQWSAPAGVLAAPDDYPALLEPRIILNGDDSGLLVFTSLAKTATTRDSGLGGNRFLYGVRLVDGAFGEPFKVHGKCFKREYGYEQSFGFDIPELVDPMDVLKWRNPEWVMIYGGLGAMGTRMGSGNVMATCLSAGSETWSAPVCLTPDNRMHSNVAACITPGGIHTIHADGGLASFQARMAEVGGQGGALLRDTKRFVTMETPLDPDPAIEAVRPDFPYASPGSTVAVQVTVENRGFRGTPLRKSDGASALGVALSLVGPRGRPLEVARRTVPEILPGEKKSVFLDVEMPMEPALLRAELIPGPFDGDLSNNVKEITLGTPAPTELTCSALPSTRYDEEGNEEARLAVLLSWKNQAVYDEILLYRDGKLFASAPGKCHRWLDRQADPGAHVYEIRGRILVSKSERTSCSIDLVSLGGFFRGDADGKGSIEITDAIYLLSYLFLGGPAPSCPDAADADDNGQLEITDAIAVLSYLFLGGRPPAAPGPMTCGPDPTADDLPPCRTSCR